MKKKDNLKLVFLTITALIIALSSCKKDYYIDGGLHNPKYDGTILEFLKSRPELFDTLIKVVDLANYTTLLNDPNANITFFAATNQSINKSVIALNRQLFLRGQDTVLDVSQISPDVWHKFLSNYIYPEKFLLKDYPQIDTNDMLAYPGQGYLSISGVANNIGTFYNDVKTKNSAGVEQIVKYAGYRQILINYSNPVATSDLQPNNGVIHVLQYARHTFGFNSFDFTNDAINKGITY